MKFNCPKCTDEDVLMTESEGTLTCDTCKHELELDEATTLFESGEIVAVVEENELSEFATDIAALVEGEDLSESFKEKAKVIFESAVQTRVDEKVEEMRTEIEESVSEDLTEKVDGYIEYVTTKWLEENEVSIEKNLKSEMNEKFIEGLSKLFSESYVDVQEDRKDLVEELVNSLEETKSRVAETVDEVIELKAELVEAEKAIAFKSISEDLAQSQVEKLLELSEKIDADSVEDFSEKVTILKESYFSGNGSDNTPTEDEKGNQIVESKNLDSDTVDYIAAAAAILKK